MSHGAPNTMPITDDIAVASIPAPDPWAEAALALLLDAPDVDAAAERSRAVFLASGVAERARLRDGLGALQGAVRWGAPPDDVRLWVTAGLAADADVRQRATRGPFYGTVRGDDGRLRVPSLEALREWEDERNEMTWVTWSLWVEADDAEWIPLEEEGRGRELEERREEAWGLRQGGRVGGTGRQVAKRLGLSGEGCGARLVRWTDSEPSAGVAYVPGATTSHLANATPSGAPTRYSSLVDTRAPGALVVVPVTVTVDRSDEVPARPDQCLARHEVAAAVEEYNDALIDRLDLEGLRVLPEAGRSVVTAP